MIFVGPIIISITKRCHALTNSCVQPYLPIYVNSALAFPELKSSGGDAEAAIELRSVNKKNA